MQRKLKIPYPVIVEGKYDRLRLLNVIDAHIITTDGFGIFKKNEKLALLRRLSENSKIIVVTDSDGAGKVIRSHITGAVSADKLIQLYIPKIEGKEKRKATPSAEGTLGVEGMENELLYKLFEPFESEEAVALMAENRLSKVDFYIDGYSGGENSAARRDELAEAFGLPSGMSANALLAALKYVSTYEEYLAFVGREES